MRRRPHKNTCTYILFAPILLWLHVSHPLRVSLAAARTSGAIMMSVRTLVVVGLLATAAVAPSVHASGMSCIACTLILGRLAACVWQFMAHSGSAGNFRAECVAPLPQVCWRRGRCMCRTLAAVCCVCGRWFVASSVADLAPCSCERFRCVRCVLVQWRRQLRILPCPARRAAVAQHSGRHILPAT